MKWLSIKDVATLLNVTERAIQIATKKGKYKYQITKGVGGNSGEILQIALESLPQEAQDKYKGQVLQQQDSVYLYLTKVQRDIVDHKYITVMKYKDFKESYPKADKLQAFLITYNEEHPNKPLTKRQLNHWEHIYNRDGINGLVDRRGGYNKGQTSIPDEAWKVFLKLWSNTTKPSAEQCYRMTQHHFSQMELPHISSFKRKLQTLDKPYVTLYREGKKAYEDKCMPHILIDYSKISSNQQWVADHHIFDVLVVDEKGDVFRPWLSGWIDRRSRYVVGYVVNKASPNSDIVLDSFARACHKCGIPEETQLDNGKDYKVYDLFNNDFPLSVTKQLGIHVTNALPYNAKAKAIERLFGTLEGKYCKLLPSYIGNDPKKRPEKMQKVNAKLKDECMPYKDFLTFVDNMIKDYNNSSHTGEGMNGRTPLDVYKNSFIKPIRIVKDEEILNLFLQRTTKPINVKSNGIKVPEIGFYFDDNKLFPYQGKQVIARYNSDNVKKVYVYDTEDNFICIAVSKTLSILNSEVTKETIRENNRRKKERRKITKSLMPDVIPPTIEEHVASKSENIEDFNIKNENSILTFNPIKHKHMKEIKKEEQRQAEREQPIQEKKAVNGMSTRKIDNSLYQLIVNGKVGGQ